MRLNSLRGNDVIMFITRRVRTARPFSRQVSTQASSNVSTGLIAGNLVLSSFLVYSTLQVDAKWKKFEEHLDFGMDRIDE